MLRSIRREPETAPPAVQPSHPHPDQLERFMRTELPKLEVVPIVRHLLTGCTQCKRVTRRLWTLGESA